MTVKKKENKIEHQEEAFIKKASSLDLDQVEKIKQEEDSLQVFTLRIPKSFICHIDELRKKDVGKTSRNTWILEAIDNRLKSK